MRWPECAHVSFEYLEVCAQFGVDLQEIKRYRGDRLLPVALLDRIQSIATGFTKPSGPVDPRPVSRLELPPPSLSSVGTAIFPDAQTDAPESGAGPQPRQAGFWIRTAAWVIDLVCLFLATITLVLIVLTTVYLGGQLGGEINDQVMALAWYASAAIIMLSGVAYFTIFVGSCGQTPGKMIFCLKIVRFDGQEMTVDRALLRSLCWILSLLLFSIGFLMVALTRQKRGLHDILAGTSVIRLRRSP